MLFCAFSINFFTVNAQPQVGNGVGVPTLSQAIATTLSSGYNPMTNTLQINFDIVGELDFDVNCTISNSTINFIPFSTFVDFSQITDDINFDNCTVTLHDFALIDVLSSWMTVTGGSFNGGTFDGSINLMDGSIGYFTSSVSINNLDLFVESGQFIARNCTFTNSLIFSNFGTTQASPYVRLADCEIKDVSSFNAVGIRQGLYYGTDNTFRNNKSALALGAGFSAEFTNVIAREFDSDFTDNTINGVRARGAVNVKIKDNCVFTGTERPIQSEAGLQTFEAIDNEISGVGDEFGIHVSLTNGVLVEDNNLFNIASGGGNGAITVANNLGGIVRENIINDGGANGLRFINFIEGVIDDNTSNTSNCNINAEMGMDNYYNQNDLNNSNVVNMAVAGSVNLRATCNNAFGGPKGVLFSGDMQGLDFEKNSMINHTGNGLTYNEDVMAPFQVDKSNDWFFNTLDAEHRGGFFPANNSQYIVHPTDMPSTFTPANWFDPMGNTSLWNCLTFGGGGFFGDTSEEIDALVHSIDCAGHGLGPAYCMWHKMVALYLIDQDPSLLSDPDLATFHAIESGSVIDQLPVLWEIVQGLPQPNLPTMALTYDSNGEISNLSSYLSFMDTQLNPAVDQYEIDFATAIQNRKNQINAIVPSNTLETDYKTMALHYMKSLEMGTFNTTEENAIVTMAESCFVNEGPAVYIARTIATKESWNYTIPTSCLTIGSHSAGLDEEASDKMRVFPNPAMDVLTIEVSEDTKDITIMDILGQSIELIPTDGQTRIRLDLGNYMSGMYWFKADNENQPLKVTVQR